MDKMTQSPCVSCHPVTDHQGNMAILGGHDAVTDVRQPFSG